MSFSRAKREELREKARRLYTDRKFTTEKIASELSINETTARAYLIQSGIELQKRWSRSHGVVDGKKQCRICNVWLPVENFCKRSTGQPYSYCRPCDCNRAVKLARRNRRIIVERELKFNNEIASNNQKVRELLRKAREFISYQKGNVAIVNEIDMFFISERNLLKMSDV